MRKELDALRLDDQGNIIDANQREDDTQVECVCGSLALGGLGAVAEWRTV